MAECPVKHIAFIMDGNGRWAKKRLLPREYGHKAGADVFENIVTYCKSIGIGAVTVYAFSTENWKRPKREVDAIFKLFWDYMQGCAEKLNKNNVRMVFIGDRGPFDEAMRSKMDSIEKLTEKNESYLYVAINYGGRAEICHAVNELIAEGKTHITEADISSRLYTKYSPDPDLIVRTGGEYRLSNFLMWQSAYSEIYITDTLWPDMKNADVDKAIEEYNRRNRRFGGV